MPKPNHIELPTGERIPILYEDRSVLAIDKPRGWMLVPFSWQKTGRNLQAALTSSIAAKDFWARSRNLKYLRFVHRLDADTSGILLLAKSPGAVDTFGSLFESRRMEKVYLAVVHGTPELVEWTCCLKLAPHPKALGKMRVDARKGKEAETGFCVLQCKANTSLVEARPVTGRTHQIRVHLAECGHPVVGDLLYGPQPVKEGSKSKAGALTAVPSPSEGERENRRQVPGEPRHLNVAGRASVPASRDFGRLREVSRLARTLALPTSGLGLRAVRLAYMDPFVRRPVEICAPIEVFVCEYGFDVPKL